MMKKILALMAMLSLTLLLFPVSGYSARTNWGGTDRTKQLGRQLPYDLVYFGQERDGVSTMVSGSVAIPLGYAVVKKEIYSNTPITLANGVEGQVLYFVVSVYSSSDADAQLAPTTTTGFTSLDFNAVGDSVTLNYVDDTVGWILIGSNSVTINQ